MSLGRLVPWSSWEEWHQVGDWLLSADPIKICRGLERVAAWRVRGRVPLGVDSTACFVETRLRDDTGELSQLPLRMQYSLAVVRMVNGIADSSQKGRVAASVASLAASVGLPRILVDLRHEATHNELPSLAALRLAATNALSWLRSNYWQRQSDQLEVNRNKLNGLLADYVGSHVAAAVKAAAASQRPSESDGSDEDELTAAAAETPKPDSGEYNVAAARKQRQSLLTELRITVPRPCSSVLLEGLLRAQQQASLETSSAVVTRALTHAMKHLREGWPVLDVLLLEAAASGLVAKSTAVTSQRGPGDIENLEQLGDLNSVLAAADWKIWCEVFESMHGGLNLSLGAAHSILASALGSLGGHVQGYLLRWAAAGGDSGSAQQKVTENALEKRKIESLCTIVQLLMKHLNDGAAAVGEKCSQIVAACQAGQFHSPNLLSDIQRTQAMILRGGASAGSSNGGSKRAREGDDAGADGRWKTAKDWSPCAIGMMPSAVDPNGKLPRLDVKGAVIELDHGLINERPPDKNVASAIAAPKAAVNEEEEEEEKCMLKSALPDVDAPAAIPAAAKCKPPSTVLSLI